jgi:hypothetical protein
MMAILETLRNSKLLKHQKPVLILMYPSRLANFVRPGKKLRLFHGHNGEPMRELLPMADYALRTDFAKDGVDFDLSPMVFSTTNVLTATAYAMKRSTINEIRKKKPTKIDGEIKQMFQEAFNSFGCVHVHELKIPKRFSFSAPKVERLVNDSLNEIVAVVNRPVSPIASHLTWKDVITEIFDSKYPHSEQDILKEMIPDSFLRQRYQSNWYDRFMSTATGYKSKIPKQKIPIYIKRK